MAYDREFFKTREMLEYNEEKSLASCALKSSRTQRLIPIPSEGRIFDYRSEFQRDRDRIIYSRAFRRLKNKARITWSSDEDHGRDRLSHSIEVSQIARTIGRGLKLNEDLIEAISLGHELGVPPFGETAERILDALLRGKLMKEGGILRTDRLGFRKNRQALRVVDLIEKRYEHEGLNLTNDVREGILKQGEWGDRILYPDLKKDGLRLGLAPVFEAQVVAVADSIAIRMESLDDGLRSREFDLQQVEKLPIVREFIKKVGKGFISLKSNFLKIASLNRGLTHLLVTNVIYHSSRSIGRWLAKNGVDSTDAFYRKRESIQGDEISFPLHVGRLFEGMQDFLSMKLMHSSHSQRADERGKRIVRTLFNSYYSNPLILDDYLLLRHREYRHLRFLRDVPGPQVEKEIAVEYQRDPAFVRLLCDHIAGMTDSYALKEFDRLQ